MPLDEISRGMVAARHAELAETPSAANHVMRSFRSVWNHARRTCELPEPPTVAIEWFPERPSLEIIQDLRAWREADGLDLALEIDGGVHAGTAPSAREAGAEILVAGSAVYRADDYGAAMEALRG